MTAVTELSPCGTYLFVGLRHVRVFAVDPITGPQIILNVEMGTDTLVTVMSWSNAGDRFLITTSTEKTTSNEAVNTLVTTKIEATELWNYSTDGLDVDRQSLDFSCFKRENNRLVSKSSWSDLLCRSVLLFKNGIRLFNDFYINIYTHGIIKVHLRQMESFCSKSK